MTKTSSSDSDSLLKSQIISKYQLRDSQSFILRTEKLAQEPHIFLHATSIKFIRTSETQRQKKTDECSWYRTISKRRELSWKISTLMTTTKIKRTCRQNKRQESHEQRRNSSKWKSCRSNLSLISELKKRKSGWETASRYAHSSRETGWKGQNWSCNKRLTTTVLLQA